jgi:hypothetical protein
MRKLTIGIFIIAGGLGLGLGACGSATTTTVGSATPAPSGSTGPSAGTSSQTTSAASASTSGSANTTPQTTPASPSGGPCDGHPCIGDWSKEAAEGGTVAQCVDGTWSHAGGISGACSHHGGEGSPRSGESGDGPAAPSTSVPSAPTQPAPLSGPGGLRPCDQNIWANANTSCDFASNTFYEYWQATGGEPRPVEQSVEAWSPVTQRSYTQICTNDGHEVDCTHNTNDEVQFSSASVMAYTQPEANTYAASGKLGP